MSTSPCRRCGGMERKFTPQTFRDGSRHIRETCTRCGLFQRYAKQRGELPHVPQRQTLPIAPAPCPASVPDVDAAPANTADLSGSRQRTEEARALLAERFTTLNTTLHDLSLDHPALAAIQAALVTAAANLDPTNIANRATKIRSQ